MNGRPDQYLVRGKNVAQEPWFRRACNLVFGDEYVATDVMQQRLLGGAPVASAATARPDSWASAELRPGLCTGQCERLLASSVKLPNDQAKAHP